MLRKVVVLVSVVVGVLGLGCFAHGGDPDEGLTFYLPFDNSLDAKVPGGIETPQKAPEVQYEEGVKGKAVVINGVDKLTYKVKEGYFLFEEGTISIWVKSNYDNAAFRKEVSEDIKTQGWYFAQSFIEASDWWRAKLALYLCQTGKDSFQANVYTYPLIQHLKTTKLFLEKGKWVNFLYTWHVMDESLDFYIDGKKVKGAVSGLKDSRDLWDMPEKIRYNLCRIDIGGGSIQGEKTDAERKEILAAILPDNYTHTIDEVRIYDRVLDEEEIEQLSSK